MVEISARSCRQVPAGVSVSDFGDLMIAPGYIDLHIHGSAGYDVMDDTAEALPAIERLLVRHGVTSYFPTTVTVPTGTTLRALERLADAIEAREGNHANTDAKIRALPLGIHLEGPFLSHARRGVHPAENLLVPTLSTFEQFWQAGRGRIRMMTIAPELEGAVEVITEAARRGVCVSLDIPMPILRRPNAESRQERGTLRIRSMPCVRWIIARWTITVLVSWVRCSQTAA